MLPPHSLATTYSNNELFAMLRRGAGKSEYLRQCHALTRPEFEGRRAAGLSIVVSPGTGDRTAYVIAVRNVGPNTYQNVRVRYEPLLLNAGNFGLDTTHMPSDVARKVAEIVEFPSIAPGQSVHVVRPGYGPHDQYDGPRTTVKVRWRGELRSGLFLHAHLLSPSPSLQHGEASIDRSTAMSELCKGVARRPTPALDRT
jgi:hypothetical protein